MNALNITLIQTPLYWEDKTRNRAMFDERLSGLGQTTDLIVLPEMFLTAFSMNTGLADTMHGESISWIREKVALMKTPVCGSLMIEENGKFVNRFIWMRPDGEVFYSDKRHLFRMGNEHHHFDQGDQRMIIEYKGWRLFPVVCYDLRFPVWLRRTKEFDYDAIIVVANWPERRSHHWRILLQARAIENQCFVIAVNRNGMDGNGVDQAGGSGIISPRGEWIADLGEATSTQSVTINIEDVSSWRTSFPAGNDADSFSLR